jgi:hypothetical protein
MLAGRTVRLSPEYGDLVPAGCEPGSNLGDVTLDSPVHEREPARSDHRDFQGSLW